MNRRDELDAIYLILCRGCGGKICTVNCPGAEYDHCAEYNKAVRLYDEGWRRQIEAEWIKMEYSDDYKCSHCTYIHCNGEELRRNPQHFLYCGHCGAKMKLKGV